MFDKARTQEDLARANAYVDSLIAEWIKPGGRVPNNMWVRGPDARREDMWGDEAVAAGFKWTPKGWHHDKYNVRGYPNGKKLRKIERRERRQDRMRRCDGVSGDPNHKYESDSTHTSVASAPSASPIRTVRCDDLFTWGRESPQQIHGRVVHECASSGSTSPASIHARVATPSPPLPSARVATPTPPLPSASPQSTLDVVREAVAQVEQAQSPIYIDSAPPSPSQEIIEIQSD